MLAEIEAWPADILADYAHIGKCSVRTKTERQVRHWASGLFFLIGRRAVVLHAFVKKSQQTPERELARKRLKELLNG